MIYKYSQLKKRMTYNDMEKHNCKETSYHLGQLKLLMSEIMFLSKTFNPGNKVLYIGAAEGYHIYQLAVMFPMLTFDLWDPGRFGIEEHKNIKKFNYFFTNKTAETYKNQGGNILLMSDIRNLEIANVRHHSEEKLDDIILEDNKKQLSWVRIIRPRYAFLKFRLGYLPGQTEYLTGKIYLQPYSPLSTETRLFTKNYDDIISYDNIEFDEKMAYFNCFIRLKNNINDTRWNDIMKKYKIKNIWDNSLTLYIINHYLDKVKNIKSDEETVKLFNEIINFMKKKYKQKYDVVYDK